MIRVAVSGYGWWGQHVAKRLESGAGFDLAGLFAPGLTRPSAGGRNIYPSFEAILEDASVEAVILTCPNDQHEPQSVAAAGAGKHVFCEKPLSLTGESARRILEAVTGAGKVLGVGHERRFEPAMQRLAAMVGNGDLGTIMHVEAAFSHDKLARVGKGNWRTLPHLAPAAGMTGMGIHLTDLMIWMFGPVASVQALTTDRSLGWETGDVVSAQLKFRAGMTATLSAILHTLRICTSVQISASDRIAIIKTIDTFPSRNIQQHATANHLVPHMFDPQAFGPVYGDIGRRVAVVHLVVEEDVAQGVPLG